MKLILVFLLSIQIGFAVEEENQRVDLTKHAVSYLDRHEDLYVYIPGLVNDLFQEFKMKSSKGPKWRETAEEMLSNDFNLDHNSSYYGESYSGECDEYFSDPEYGPYDTDEVSVHFEWQSVKKIKGSKKSVMYIVDYYTQLIGDLKVDGSRECHLFENEFVFLNKLDGGKPIYLGRRVDNLPSDVK